jgi:predicted permease
MPITLPSAAPAGRKNGWLFAVARLKPGVTLEEAGTALAAISQQLAKEYPQSNEGSVYYAESLRDALLGNTKQPLILLFAAVGVVLLVACANVGNLLLARAIGRRQEMAVRVALGAGRARLAAQLVTESLALALVAGCVGIAIAYWGVPALVSLVPTTVSVPGLQAVGINAGVVVFTLALCVATALVFSLASVLMIRTESGASALVAQTRVTTSASARRATSVLVVIEVALAAVLLVSAGLIMRSFARLLAVDPGFTVERVLVMGTSLPPERYQPVAARQAFYARAFAALQALPGVERAGAAAVVPLTGNNWTVPFDRADRPLPAGQRPPDVGWQSASGGYFEALHIPLVAGRLFDSRDTPDSAPVVIVSEAIQKQFYGVDSAIGRHVKLGATDAEIIGVVGNIRRAGLSDTPRADMYFPFEQGVPGSTALFIRTSGDPLEAVAAVQGTLKGIEPAVVFAQTQTLATIASRSVADTRLALWLFGLFAVVALALSAVGVYGVMSYVVRQRTREIGTRIALGASHGDIVWGIMRQGGGIAAAGLATGLVAGLAMTRSLNALLYGVTASDPLTLSVAMSVLAISTLAACYIPARRAARLDAARTLAGQQ